MFQHYTTRNVSVIQVAMFNEYNCTIFKMKDFAIFFKILQILLFDTLTRLRLYIINSTNTLINTVLISLLGRTRPPIVAILGWGSVINVNDAADLLKAFLRELPNPLLPSEHFGTHISIADMKTSEGNKKRSSSMI